MYIGKLDNIVNKCNSIYHRKIKMKPVDVNQAHKILNLKSVILLEYWSIKIFLQKAMFKIGLKNISLLQKLKILIYQHMLLAILKPKKLSENFTKKNCKSQVKKS